MYEKKKLTNAKRLLSIVMSAALVFSTFQNTSLTSYALESEYSKEISKDIEDAESGSVCLKETDTEQESGVSEETDTEQESGVSEETDTEQESGVSEETDTEQESGVSEETDTEYESSASEEFVLAKENEMQILEDGTEEISANNEGQNDTYIGTISNEEGRQGLIIDAWEIQEAGLEFNNEEIINILRIRRDNNEKYNFVNVNYDSVTNLISKDVWNAAVEILESEENRSLRFNFAGDDSADENWYFEKPEAVMEDINTDTEFIINDTEQNATICFAKTDFNADFVNISFNLNSEKNGYDSFKSAFENISFFEIADSEGNIENVSAAYSYNNEESWATLDIWNVKKLSANMDYTIQQGVYRGHVDSWDESGYEVTCLNVISSEVNKDVLDTDEIISALESHEGESFDEIYIEASEGNTNTISKDVINTAAGLLKNTQERDKILKFGFNNNTNNTFKEWQLINPTTSQESDQTVSAAITVSENEKVSISISEHDFSADRVDIIFGARNESSYYNTYKNIFGENEGSLTIGDNVTSGWFWVNEYNVCIKADNINTLTANTIYLVEKYVYSGEEEDEEGRSKLRIDSSKVNESGMEFNDEAILSILNSKSEKGKTFDIVEINYTSEAESVSANLWNSVIPLLSAECENKTIRFSYWGNTVMDKNFIVENPYTTQADIVFGANVNIGEKDKGIEVQFANTDIPAENIMFNIYTESSRTDAQMLADAFGNMEGKRLSVTDTDGNIVDGSKIWANSWLHNYEDGSYELWFDTGNIKNLASNKIYKVLPQKYKGNINSWIDEAGTERFTLDISPTEIGKNEFAPEEIIEIFELNKGISFDEIIINYVGDSEVLNKDIINKSTEILRESTQEFSQSLRFNFWKTGEQEGVCNSWTLINPTANQAQNIPVSSSLQISENNKVIVTVNADTSIVSAESLNASFGVENGRALYTEIKNIFGEEPKSLMTDEDATDGWYHIDEYNIWINVHNVSNLTAEKSYIISEYVYHGNVFEGESGKELYISSFYEGNNSFEKDQVINILKYHQDKGNVFDKIVILEGSSGNDIIKKDYINQARLMLDENGDNKVVIFGFVKIEAANEGKSNEIAWCFYEPEEVQADINVNVSLTAGLNGLMLKTPDLNISARDIKLEFAIDRTLPTAIEWINAIGEPSDKAILVLDGNYKIYRNVGTDYSQNNNVMIFYINGVQELSTNTEYLFLVAKDIENKIVVGEKHTLNVSNPVDDGTEVAWYSYDEGVATVLSNGEVTAHNQGEFSIVAVYKSGGKEYIEAWCGIANYELRKIVFDKSELTMELPPEGEEWESLEYLQVKWYPANAAIPQEKLTWVTSDDSVVKTGSFGGEIKAVAPGTATIKAIYNETVYAECNVTVKKAAVIPDCAWPEDVYVITNFSTKLSDAYGLTNGWKWQNPDTSLAPFENMYGHSFPAVYTLEDGRSIKAMLWIRIITVTGVSIEAIEKHDTDIVYVEKPVALTAGESVVLNYRIITKDDNYIDLEKLYELADIQWKSNPDNIGAQNGLEDYYPNSYKFTSNESATGKKTFTVTITDKKTKKTIATDSYTLTVTKKPVIDFNNMVVEMEFDNEMTGKFHFRVSENNYYNLTVKSLDNSVLKLGKALVNTIETEFGKEIDTVVPFEFKKKDYAYVSVSAADEIKSTTNVRFEISDAKPDISTETISINKALSDKTACLEIYLKEMYPVSDVNAIVLGGADAGKFSINSEKINDTLIKTVISLKDTNLKKGNYKVDVKIPVLTDVAANEVKDYTYSVKISVLDSVPKVNIKQPQKVNLFYTDAEGSGIITIDAGSDEVESLELKDSDYVLEYAADNNYFVRLKENSTGADKNGSLRYKIVGYDTVYSKNFTVKTEVKAPEIQLSETTKTLYTKYGHNNAQLQLMDKVTGEYLDLSEVSLVKSKNDVQIITSDGIEAKLKKNTYTISAINGTSTICFVLNTNNAGSDKLTLRINESNWSKSVDVKYSIKAVTTEPKLILESKSLALNKNKAIFASQISKTFVYLAGNKDVFPADRTLVSFEGTDEKSEKVLNDSLILEYWDYTGEIVARFNDNSLEKGNYKYNVTVEFDSFKVRTALTIKILDEEPQKNIKVSKKGSIDVLDRDNTYTAFIPAVKNMSGEVVGAYLNGADSDLFESYWDYEKQQLIVKAKEYEIYSTKNTYTIQPVFALASEQGYYEVNAQIQKLKVKQGKPTIKVSSVSNTLYTRSGNELYIDVEAVLNGQNVEISNVSLENYTNDLWLKDIEVNDGYGNSYYSQYDPENKQICLSKYSDNEILKFGKACNLKLKIYYRDKAGNEKDKTVTYKVIIK